MKLLLKAMILLAFTGSMPACKKCMSCQTTDKKTGKTVDNYPEICGRKKSLDTQELTYRFNLPDTLQLTCPRK
jgi:hypothetical protein